jgi:hypothetical protein
VLLGRPNRALRVGGAMIAPANEREVGAPTADGRSQSVEAGLRLIGSTNNPLNNRKKQHNICGLGPLGSARLASASSRPG